MSHQLQDLQGLCQICYEFPFKYKCPRCATKTCSVQCVKKHKEESQCDGSIDNTKFIQKTELQKNPNLVNRDYNFLMKLDRTISVSKNDLRANHKRIAPPKHMVNKRFQRAGVDTEGKSVVKRSVNVKLLPRGMHRASLNASGFDKKTGDYRWSVEWKVTDYETGEQTLEHLSSRISEESTLNDALPKRVLNALDGKAAFLFLQKVDTPANNPSYIPLNGNSLVADALRDQTVIEFPTILVSTNEWIKGWSIYTESKNASSDLDSESSSASSSSSDELSGDSSEDVPEESSSKEPVIIPDTENKTSGSI